MVVARNCIVEGVVLCLLVVKSVFSWMLLTEVVVRMVKVALS